MRNLAALKDAVAEGIFEFGHIDIVIANAGIGTYALALHVSEQMWQDVIDIDLTGAWKTVIAALPPMIERGEGGSVILTSSIAGLVAHPNMSHYVAAKHGIVGLMQALAIELAPHFIRVNSVHPTTVDTPMAANQTSYELFMGGLKGATREQAAVGMKTLGRHADSVGRSGGRQQRRAVFGLRRGSLRHWHDDGH